MSYSNFGSKVVCPNCGAPTTNHINCDYCGSLLVRLLDHKIDPQYAHLLDDEQCYKGMVVALQSQMLLHKQHKNTPTVTDIYLPKVKHMSKYVSRCSVVRSGFAGYADGTLAPSQSKQGLCIVFTFAHYDNLNFIFENRTQKILHERFKQLDILPLFDIHESHYMAQVDTGAIMLATVPADVYEYSIDFGQDIVGASRIVSRVISHLYNVSLKASLNYQTLCGNDAIENSRAYFEHKFQDDKMTKVWLYIIFVYIPLLVGIILLILWLCGEIQ